MMFTTIPFRIIPIEEDGYHLHITGKVNTVEVNLLIDTGASRSVFDEQKITSLLNNQSLEEIEKLSTGLGTNTMQSKKAVIERFVIGNIEMRHYEVAVLDLTHVNSSYRQMGLEEITGVIGSDLLYDRQAVIDYRTKTLQLSE